MLMDDGTVLDGGQIKSVRISSTGQPTMMVRCDDGRDVSVDISHREVKMFLDEFDNKRGDPQEAKEGRLSLVEETAAEIFRRLQEIEKRLEDFDKINDRCVMNVQQLKGNVDDMLARMNEFGDHVGDRMSRLENRINDQREHQKQVNLTSEQLQVGLYSRVGELEANAKTLHEAISLNTKVYRRLRDHVEAGDRDKAQAAEALKLADEAIAELLKRVQELEGEQRRQLAVVEATHYRHDRAIKRFEGIEKRLPPEEKEFPTKTFEHPYKHGLWTPNA